MDYSSRSLNALVSPRGTRERLQTKRQQFEAIIQQEKDKNQEILDSLVKPYHKKAKFEDYKHTPQATYSPRLSYTIQAPSRFQGSVGSVASNKGSVVRFEDQQHEPSHPPALDDTFTREEKGLTVSASQPILKPQVNQNVHYGEDDGDLQENLKYMYPEPGLRDTFVKGVYNQSLRPKRYLSPTNAMEANPYYQLGSTYSQRKAGSVAQTRNSYEEATNYAQGVPPSYGRIIGLSRRLDKGVSDKMRVDDSQKDFQDAVKEMVNNEKQMSRFQTNALNVINHR